MDGIFQRVEFLKSFPKHASRAEPKEDDLIPLC